MKGWFFYEITEKTLYCYSFHLNFNFVLSLLIETLFLKSLTEDDYNSLIDYSDYIVRTTYLKEEDVQTQNWNYINNIKVVIKIILTMMKKKKVESRQLKLV